MRGDRVKKARVMLDDLLLTTSSNGLRFQRYLNKIVNGKPCFCVTCNIYVEKTFSFRGDNLCPDCFYKKNMYIIRRL